MVVYSRVVLVRSEVETKVEIVNGTLEIAVEVEVSVSVTTLNVFVTIGNVDVTAGKVVTMVDPRVLVVSVR